MKNLTYAQNHDGRKWCSFSPKAYPMFYIVTVANNPKVGVVCFALEFTTPAESNVQILVYDVETSASEVAGGNSLIMATR